MLVKINGYPIDLTVSEGYEFQNQITDIPVEKGSPITDHIKALPRVIELEGVVSNTPIGPIAKDASRRTEVGKPSPSQDAYQRLVAIADGGEPVTIEVGRGKFTDMGLESLSTPLARDKSKGLYFTVKFKKIRIIVNSRTIRAASPGGGRRVKFGLSSGIKMANQAVKWLKDSNIGRLVGGLVGTDAITVKNGKYYHENGKPLTKKEKEAFLAYKKQKAQQKAHQDFQNSSDGRDNLRADRAQSIMDDKNTHPGRTVDKAAFSGPTSKPKSFGDVEPLPAYVPPRLGNS